MGVQAKDYLIALSDGHGIGTPGKRTPILPPGMLSETGNFMYENEFNRAVIAKIDKKLRLCKFKTLLVSPTDADTSLRIRTNLANTNKADVYISVHANAYDGKFDKYDPQGIEVFHYPGSVAGKKLADTVYKYLIQGTKQVGRGVKTANFQELRETNMPSILVEADFMDNLDAVTLLLSDSFREECATEITKGICEYFKVPYVSEISKPKPQLFRVRKSWKDATSQIGAYNNLQSAIQVASKQVGYKVFDEKGTLVYPTPPRKASNSSYNMKY